MISIRDCRKAGEIYAQKSEITTCSVGHHLARFARDVFVGAIPSNTDFEFLHPNSCMGMKNCPECGAPVAMGNGGDSHDTFYFVKT